MPETQATLKLDTLLSIFYGKLREVVRIIMATENWQMTNPFLFPDSAKGSFARMPLRAKITLPYLLLAIALAFGAIFIVFQIVFDTIEERFTNQLIETGRLASERMVREELARLETLRLLTNLQGLAPAVEDRDAEKLRELTFGIVLNNQEEAVELLDNRGNLILSMRKKTGGYFEDYAFAKSGGDFFLQWEFVQSVLQGKQDLRGERFSGLVQSDWGNYFYVAGPVYDERKQLLGVVLVGKSLDTLSRQIREETLSQVSFYKQNGLPLQSTFAETHTLQSGEINLLASSSDQVSLRRIGLISMNVEYDELIGPWKGRSTDLGWMGVSLAKSFLIKASWFTRMRISLLFSAGFVMVIVLGIYLANHITRPLTDLVNACRKVAQGDLKVQIQPVSNDELATLAESFNFMVSHLGRSKEDLVNAYDTTLEGWAQALELRDKETEGHTQRAVTLTIEIARRMGFREDQLIHVRRGVLLHDIGKMGIPDSILLKNGPLTPEEWIVMRKHPDYAVKMLSHIDFLKPALNIPYAHHERWDGTGYPRGLKGEDIPLEARIFAVVDVWDAICSARPYRAAIPQDRALEIIKESSGTHLDPQVVNLFFELVFKNGKS
jgi:HD-GYP domain-containing protein (c-di-GMP phosphodiesterase class II)